MIYINLSLGVFTGYNLLNVALALPKDGKVIACDISSDGMEIGRPFLEEVCILRIKCDCNLM